MATVMKASEFVKKLTDVANNYKTLYVMGCFGSPMTESIKKRYTGPEAYDYNNKPARVKMINAASADTFGFDCVNLIKGILWGWSGDKKKTYGGAKYKTNGVPDTNANGMIKLCNDVTTDFSSIEVGEAVWCTGHIGVYIGNGLAVECTPAWKNRVQITAVKNIGTKAGYNARKWTKHGKLPYIEYDVDKEETSSTPAKKEYKIDSAPYMNKELAGSYEVTASALNLRSGVGIKKSIVKVLKKGATVRNYGFYGISSRVKWLLVVAEDGTTGFCSSKYLNKR